MSPVTRVFDEPGLLVQERGNPSYSLAGRLAYIGTPGASQVNIIDDDGSVFSESNANSVCLLHQFM